MKLLLLPLLLSSLLASYNTAHAFQISATTGATTTTTTTTCTANRFSFSALHYSVAADMPRTSRTPTFIEEKMRHLKTKDKKTTVVVANELPNNMMEISNRSDFERLVVKEPHRLTVVRIHAPFCRACKAMSPLLERFARDSPDINFVQVAWNRQDPEVTQLIRSLNVNKVPFGQVYMPQVGLVEQTNMGKKYFADVAKIVESYAMGFCELPEQVNDHSKVYESPYVSFQGPQGLLNRADVAL